MQTTRVARTFRAENGDSNSVYRLFYWRLHIIFLSILCIHRLFVREVILTKHHGDSLGMSHTLRARAEPEKILRGAVPNNREEGDETGRMVCFAAFEQADAPQLPGTYVLELMRPEIKVGGLRGSKWPATVLARSHEFTVLAPTLRVEKEVWCREDVVVHVECGSKTLLFRHQLHYIRLWCVFDHDDQSRVNLILTINEQNLTALSSRMRLTCASSGTLSILHTRT